MLGRLIEDPNGMESGEPGRAEGLGLLPVRTVLEPSKVVRTVRARVGDAEGGAYEIHLGRTECDRALPPFARLEEGGTDGAVGNRVVGTYLHGIFETPAVSRLLFGECRESEHDYDELACWFERHADLNLFEERFL
jgi:adenosylcobyric acid synthase